MGKLPAGRMSAKLLPSKQTSFVVNTLNGEVEVARTDENGTAITVTEIVPAHDGIAETCLIRGECLGSSKVVGRDVILTWGTKTIWLFWLDFNQRLFSVKEEDPNIMGILWADSLPVIHDAQASLDFAGDRE